MFYLLDVALVLLRTTSVGRFCLRTSKAGMQLDVGLDYFLCWSCDPGETTLHGRFKGAAWGVFSPLVVVVLPHMNTAKSWFLVQHPPL